MAEVILDHVTKDFGEVVAVDDANIHIRDTEFLVLVGPSGCGKTTTLRMVAGLEEVSDGKIYIGNRIVNNVPPKDRNIAMVFQNYALYPHMDVYNNMAFGLKLRKMPRAEIDRRVKTTGELLGIQELLNRRPSQLSGGQRQRVALGRAIVREPAVFLMDEPLSNLDAKLRVQMRAELQKLHDRLQTTAIYVTHDQTEAMTMGDRLVVMNEGVIQQIDSPLKLYNEPVNVFVAGFIGAPAMNFKRCILTRDNDDYKLVDINNNFTLGLPNSRTSDDMDDYIDEEVIWGIRPEDIYDATLSEEIPFEEHNTVETEVEVIEPMGAESFIYINVGEDDLGNVEDMTARVNADTNARVGETLKVAFDMSKAHVFDAETEVNLSI